MLHVLLEPQSLCLTALACQGSGIVGFWKPSLLSHCKFKLFSSCCWDSSEKQKLWSVLMKLHDRVFPQVGPACSAPGLCEVLDAPAPADTAKTPRYFVCLKSHVGHSELGHQKWLVEFEFNHDWLTLWFWRFFFLFGKKPNVKLEFSKAQLCFNSSNFSDWAL